ncbi:peptidoglycan editing factor PgeF [Qipengyuania gelatinilytica]|uniref:Purine nucleoside phosphorylase n=1 Tax=Qipengyuania gelatinilytica TaxID=2867231 RepID=A0ABX8ZZ04_9SPHN|nr:peptidoglycan editing factor PgeF [Qipengyuania gelatinilytica]QZD94250.1 peptidoglycan editing factor PgeF [Qipengyuania gelatinilytica]
MAEVLTSEALEGVPHGFSTREGLEGSKVLPGAPLVMLEQVHSPDVLVMREAGGEKRQGDGIVTDRRGLLIGIVTADCAPVLMADREAGVVGAAHAGWRGARAGVLENTLDAMERLGANRANIAAVIGPTIAQASYEVDEGFREQFDSGDERFFARGRPGHFQFDLPAYVAHRLKRGGAGRIADLALDTYADEARFHSFRRATHRSKPTTGRQTSVIALP